MQHFDEPSPAPTTAATSTTVTPPRRKGSGRVLLVVAGGLTALALLATIVVLRSGGNGPGEAIAAATPASTIPERSASTAGPTTTSQPATTVPSTVATTVLPPGVKPAVFNGPVQNIEFSPNRAMSATVAAAAVPTVSVYREPLMSPAPDFADWRFDQATQFGTPTVFLVTGTSGDWLRVGLPMKPNGTEGWVHNSEVTLAPNTKRIVVDLAERSVSVYDGTALLERSTSVVGKPTTPTPTGTYFVTDLLRLDDPSTAYGPYILAISARSDAFDFFNGGEPIVALHGTNQPSLLGRAASSGCIRLPNEVATRLATLVPMGTPVFIV